MNLGNRLKSLRVEKGLEPIHIAEKIGISETTYRRYERNGTAPSVAVLQKLADNYNLKLEELVNHENCSLYIHKNKSEYTGNVVFNQLSEKVMELYEKQAKEKELQIAELKEELKELKEELKQIRSKQ